MPRVTRYAEIVKIMRGGGRMTVNQIGALAGCSTSVVHPILRRLRMAGLVEVFTPPREHLVHFQLSLYFWVGESDSAPRIDPAPGESMTDFAKRVRQAAVCGWLGL